MSELRASVDPRLSSRTRWVAGLAFALLCALWVFPQGVRDTPYHGDEGGWISAANYHTDLLLDLDFAHDKWSETPVGAFGSLNQQLGKIILGLGLRLHPAREPGDSEFLRLYGFGRSLLWNRDHGRLAPKGILERARSVMATGSYLCVGLIFLAGWRYGNFWCGVAV